MDNERQLCAGHGLNGVEHGTGARTGVFGLTASLVARNWLTIRL